MSLLSLPPQLALLSIATSSLSSSKAPTTHCSVLRTSTLFSACVDGRAERSFVALNSSFSTLGTIDRVATRPIHGFLNSMPTSRRNSGKQETGAGECVVVTLKMIPAVVHPTPE